MEDVKYIERRVKEVFSNLIFNFEYKKCGCEIEIRNPITFKKNIFKFKLY